MAPGNAKSENSEAPLFSVSDTPTITCHKLNATNYSAWSASVEFWFLSQGHYDHLEKSLDEISKEKRDHWKKLDYQLCALLWQSVDSNILPNFKAFKTCHSFWKKAHSLFAYDNKWVYDSAQKLVTLKDSDNDMFSYVSKAQSVVEELKLYLKSDTLEEMNNKLDNLFMMLVLHAMHSDYKHVCDEILSSQELPSLEKLFIRLLQVPSQKLDGNSTSSNESHATCQRNCREPGGEEGYPNVPSGQEYVHNRQVVHFRSLKKSKEDHFSLEMSRLFTYDDVVERVAQQLGVDDPSIIRLTPHNCYSQQPKSHPIKYRGVEHLSDMLVHYNQTSDILYYEVLDIPLPELQGLKTLKVAFHHASKDEVVIHTIRLPKQSTVGDVLDDLITKVELSDLEAELRLLELFYHKIFKVVPPNEKIGNINDQHWTLHAEEIPEEKKNLGPHDRLMRVYHFTKDTAQNEMQIQYFGEPFFLVIREGKSLGEIKVKKLQVPDEEFVEDLSSSRFTWRIDNFSRMNTEKFYSEVFVVGGYKWCVLIFPKGNNVDYLSLYLDVADSPSLPYGWSRYAQFSLAVVNQIHNKYSVRRDTQHQFNARESDWGFTSFMPLGELYDPSRGYLVNDTLVVEAEVLVRRIVDHRTYDSKKETGYVGLKNQGATCYMNCLLQTLYHIPYFRKAVYHMPTTENDMPSGSIPLALQSLFYKLQYSDTSVATKELTKSFGWDTYDSFMQHDVQEMNRVLCEKLEDKMKGTVVEGTIHKLFEGHHMNYIECINVDYISTRKESFYDLQLDVKGCADVYASFDKYVEVERLEGDDRYHAEQYGLQNAKKGVLFIDFPPVLQLQLKRFEYDFMRDTMVKINDRYEFPLQLDLDRENGKYLSPEADRNVRNLYTLHSVLVHSGGVHGGHYYAFIRPTLSEQWYKFDDEKVTKEDTKQALEEQYGNEEELSQTNPGFNKTPSKFTKYSNAYMLVYIREADKDKVICNVDEKDIAEHLRERLKKEQEGEEHKKKEKAEAHLYTIIKVARDEDLTKQIGKDIYFNLVDHDKVKSFRVQKQTSFTHFKEDVAKEFGIPVQFQRFWLWAKRRNHTYRPNRPLTHMEEAQSVGQLREVSKKVHNAELKLFLEVELGLDLRPIAPPDKTKDDILLFFKLYDPEKEELCYVGRLFVKSTGKPSEILTRLNKMAGYDPAEVIGLYEEIKLEPNVMCEPIDKKVTFQASQLENGDIICFQKATPIDRGEPVRYPDVPSYLEYVYNRQVVHFRSLEKLKEDDFSLEMSRLSTYDDVVERVAQQLGVDDPSILRLTPHNCYSQQPNPQPIKYRGVEHLSDMLVHYNQTSDILYYEVLDIPLPELQGLKTLKVAFHHATKDEVVIHTIRLPKQSTVGDVLDDLKTKVELSDPEAELRLLEVFYHMIFKVFLPNEKIEHINDQYWTLRAEEIPEEEKNLGLHDRLIHVYHFTKDTAQNQMQIQYFGEPFLLVIHERETLAEIKVRIQKKLQVPGEEFVKWKFAFFSSGRPEYLQDSDILSGRLQRRDVYYDLEQYLCLEHTNNAPKKIIRC